LLSAAALTDSISTRSLVLIIFAQFIYPQGIVLAVNARTLAKDPTPFDPFLKEYPEISLLIWTATGEPPISRSKITYIEEHFKSIGCANNQVGFDCLVSLMISCLSSMIVI